MTSKRRSVENRKMQQKLGKKNFHIEGVQTLDTKMESQKKKKEKKGTENKRFRVEKSLSEEWAERDESKKGDFFKFAELNEMVSKVKKRFVEEIDAFKQRIREGGESIFANEDEALESVKKRMESLEDETHNASAEAVDQLLEPEETAEQKAERERAGEEENVGSTQEGVEDDGIVQKSIEDEKGNSPIELSPEQQKEKEMKNLEAAIDTYLNENPIHPGKNARHEKSAEEITKEFADLAKGFIVGGKFRGDDSAQERGIEIMQNFEASMDLNPDGIDAFIEFLRDQGLLVNHQSGEAIPYTRKEERPPESQERTKDEKQEQKEKWMEASSKHLLEHNIFIAQIEDGDDEKEAAIINGYKELFAVIATDEKYFASRGFEKAPKIDDLNKFYQEYNPDIQKQVVEYINAVSEKGGEMKEIDALIARHCKANQEILNTTESLIDAKLDQDVNGELVVIQGFDLLQKEEKLNASKIEEYIGFLREQGLITYTEGEVKELFSGDTDIENFEEILEKFTELEERTKKFNAEWLQARKNKLFKRYKKGKKVDIETEIAEEWSRLMNEKKHLAEAWGAMGEHQALKQRVAGNLARQGYEGLFAGVKERLMAWAGTSKGKKILAYSALPVVAAIPLAAMMGGLVGGEEEVQEGVVPPTDLDLGTPEGMEQHIQNQIEHLNGLDTGDVALTEDNFWRVFESDVLSDPERYGLSENASVDEVDSYVTTMTSDYGDMIRSWLLRITDNPTEYGLSEDITHEDAIDYLVEDIREKVESTREEEGKPSVPRPLETQERAQERIDEINVDTSHTKAGVMTQAGLYESVKPVVYDNLENFGLVGSGPTAIEAYIVSAVNAFEASGATRPVTGDVLKIAPAAHIGDAAEITVEKGAAVSSDSSTEEVIDKIDYYGDSIWDSVKHVLKEHAAKFGLDGASDQELNRWTQTICENYASARGETIKDLVYEGDAIKLVGGAKGVFPKLDFVTGAGNPAPGSLDNVAKITPTGVKAAEEVKDPGTQKVPGSPAPVPLQEPPPRPIPELTPTIEPGQRQPAQIPVQDLLYPQGEEEKEQAAQFYEALGQVLNAPTSEEVIEGVQASLAKVDLNDPDGDDDTEQMKRMFNRGFETVHIHYNDLSDAATAAEEDLNRAENITVAQREALHKAVSHEAVNAFNDLIPQIPNFQRCDEFHQKINKLAEAPHVLVGDDVGLLHDQVRFQQDTIAHQGYRTFADAERAWNDVVVHNTLRFHAEVDGNKFVLGQYITGFMRLDYGKDPSDIEGRINKFLSAQRPADLEKINKAFEGDPQFKGKVHINVSDRRIELVYDTSSWHIPRHELMKPMDEAPQEVKTFYRGLRSTIFNENLSEIRTELLKITPQVEKISEKDLVNLFSAALAAEPVTVDTAAKFTPFLERFDEQRTNVSAQEFTALKEAVHGYVTAYFETIIAEAPDNNALTSFVYACGYMRSLGILTPEEYDGYTGKLLARGQDLEQSTPGSDSETPDSEPDLDSDIFIEPEPRLTSDKVFISPGSGKEIFFYIDAGANQEWKMTVLDPSGDFVHPEARGKGPRTADNPVTWDGMGTDGPLTDGTYKVRITLLNESGPSFEKELDVTVDSTPPELNLAFEFTTDNTLPTIRIDPKDVNSIQNEMVVSFKYTRTDGAEETTVGTPISLRETLTPDDYKDDLPASVKGDITCFVTVKDRAGNETTQDVTFQLPDTEDKPTLDIDFENISKDDLPKIKAYFGGPEPEPLTREQYEKIYKSLWFKMGAKFATLDNFTDIVKPQNPEEVAAYKELEALGWRVEFEKFRNVNELEAQLASLDVKNLGSDRLPLIEDNLKKIISDKDISDIEMRQLDILQFGAQTIQAEYERALDAIKEKDPTLFSKMKHESQVRENLARFGSLSVWVQDVIALGEQDPNSVDAMNNVSHLFLGSDLTKDMFTTDADGRFEITINGKTYANQAEKTPEDKPTLDFDSENPKEEDLDNVLAFFEDTNHEPLTKDEYVNLVMKAHIFSPSFDTDDFLEQVKPKDEGDVVLHAKAQKIRERAFINYELAEMSLSEQAKYLTELPYVKPAQEKIETNLRVLIGDNNNITQEELWQLKVMQGGVYGLYLESLKAVEQFRQVHPDLFSLGAYEHALDDILIDEFREYDIYLQDLIDLSREAPDTDTARDYLNKLGGRNLGGHFTPDENDRIEITINGKTYENKSEPPSEDSLKEAEGVQETQQPVSEFPEHFTVNKLETNNPQMANQYVPKFSPDGTRFSTVEIKRVRDNIESNIKIYTVGGGGEEVESFNVAEISRKTMQELGIEIPPGQGA